MAKMTPISTRRRTAFSYPEVLASVMLVALVMVGAMNMLRSVVRGRTTTANSVRAQQFAQQLMAEVLNTSYMEGPALGPDATVLGVLFPESRSEFDDVDDFNGWTESPLQYRDGSSVPNTTGWRRSVAVAWVSATNPNTAVVLDQGVKRVTVSVQQNGTVVATLVGLRSDKYPPRTP